MERLQNVIYTNTFFFFFLIQESKNTLSEKDFKLLMDDIAKDLSKFL